MSAAAGVSMMTATAIAVADMIGIGVFTSLGFQVQGIPSGFSLIMLWVLGGVASLCGALSYAELAAAFPRSGGEYNFLSRIYHPAVGFLAGWISATVGFAAPVALAAMALGGYAQGIVPDASPVLVGLGTIWFVTLLQLRGVRQTIAFQNIWTIGKVLLIIAFILASFTLGSAQPISFTPAASDWSYMTAAPFAISLVFVMYSYSGWNAATYIIGEVGNPQKTLPRALVAATLIVVLLYVGLNWVFLYTTPVEKLAGQLDVAQIVGKHIFGDTGGRVVGAIICLGLVSSISAMMWIGPRVTATMGEDIPAFRHFARKSQNGVPVVAVLFQLAVVNLLFISRSFESVLDYIQFSLTASSFLTVLGVIVLRWTKPTLVRPYRVWGYPLTPMVFLSVSLYVMRYLITNRPLQSLAGAATICLGLLVYLVTRGSRMGPATGELPTR